MEENARRDAERPEESSQVILPLLQQAGNQQPHRNSNFYIDNILRPDFGRKRKERTLVLEGNSLGAITERKELTRKKPPKTGNQHQGGAGSKEQHPHPVRRGAGDRSRGPQAGGAPAAKAMLWPAWVYCTRYSDRPSSGPRSRKPKKAPTPSKEDKRPRTAFTSEQLQRLKTEFQNNRYLTEQRRQSLARDLNLSESQIKIWFQNKRAKIKKSSGNNNPLAAHLMAQGLYNHSTAKDAKSDSD